MAEQPVIYAVDGALAFITLNRPERLNALNRELIAGVESAVARANADRDIRVIVLRRAGRAFCAGCDLQTAPQAEATAQDRAGGWDPIVDSLGMSQDVQSFMSL